MDKLLKADFARLKKDIFFWLVLSASFICGIVFACLSLNEWGFDYDYTFMLFLAIGAFIALFVYRENSNGAIRNKVVVGHTKGDIFLSGLIVHIVAALIMTLTFLLPVGVLCFEWLKKAPAHALLITLGGLLLASVTCAVIFTVIMYLTPQKIIGAFLCPVLIMSMFFATYQVEFYLYQPEYTTVDYELENGEKADKVQANPHAAKGFGRVLLIAADSLMPQGQSNSYFFYISLWAYPEIEPFDDYAEPDKTELVDTDDELIDTLKGMLPYIPIYSISLSGTLALIGWAVFRKKELK